MHTVITPFIGKLLKIPHISGDWFRNHPFSGFLSGKSSRDKRPKIPRPFPDENEKTHAAPLYIRVKGGGGGGGQERNEKSENIPWHQHNFPRKPNFTKFQYT